MAMHAWLALDAIVAGRAGASPGVARFDPLHRVFVSLEAGKRR